MGFDNKVSMVDVITQIRAQAKLQHAYFLGLQLMVSSRKGPQVMGDWMFNLFRRQHLDKFLSSFEKLGLSDEPHAVACAKYHVLSNNIGGVGVEFMPESDRKAWVRFRYPRWMYDGPTICGVPVEVSRGFLRGWYAYNGVSLGNPRLGYVCVSEDMTGEFGLCGYFYEYDHDLADDERLRFAKGEMPPAFDPELQPQPPADQWSEERLEKANRNYALEYVRNGLSELAKVLGMAETLELGTTAARLIGLQYFQEIKDMLNVADGGVADCVAFLVSMCEGMGDSVQVDQLDIDKVAVTQSGLRAARGLTGDERNLVLNCWNELMVGAGCSQQQRKALTAEVMDDQVRWQIQPA